MKIGIVFDLDGTLWDSSNEVSLAWNRLLGKRGLPLLSKRDMERVMGLPMDKLARALFPWMEPQESYDLMEACTLEENDYLEQHGARLYPGVEETLRTLAQKYSLYIVSNCQCGYIEAFLSYYQMESMFADFQCFGMNRKQKGENIKILAQRNDLDRIIYVGDIESDYHATIEAGGQFVHAAYGFGTLSPEITKKVPALRSFSELPEVLENL